MEAQMHHTQKSTGTLAGRHARVLLAKDASELERAYDGWAEDYDADLVAISGGGENTSALAACRVLVENIDVKDRGIRMLDFGCGTGPAALFLFQHGMDTLQQLDGCDLSAGMLAKAAERNLYRTLIKADFATSHCTPKSYDAIHCSAVFAPAQAPPSTFDEFHLLLKVGGRAVFTVRCEYYDSAEGAEHKDKLESMLHEGKWTLIEKSKRAYLPNDGVLAYVFVLQKI
ncbi:hypothetical protein ACHAXT_003963 [Thalassiosira profunda]